MMPSAKDHILCELPRGEIHGNMKQISVVEYRGENNDYRQA